MNDDRHGTYAGAQRHYRAGERPCEECREAARAYMAQWRADNPEKARATALRARARAAEATRLGRALQAARATGRVQGP